MAIFLDDQCVRCYRVINEIVFDTDNKKILVELDESSLDSYKEFESTLKSKYPKATFESSIVDGSKIWMRPEKKPFETYPIFVETFKHGKDREEFTYRIDLTTFDEFKNFKHFDDDFGFRKKKWQIDFNVISSPILNEKDNTLIIRLRWQAVKFVNKSIIHMKKSIDYRETTAKKKLDQIFKELSLFKSIEFKIVGIDESNNEIDDDPKKTIMEIFKKLSLIKTNECQVKEIIGSDQNESIVIATMNQSLKRHEIVEKMESIVKQYDYYIRKMIKE